MCEKCDYEELLRLIEDLLNQDDKYGWAYVTLDGIHNWVYRNSHATEEQWRAIRNIEKSKN
jgi:hypothetical protein